MAVYFFTFTGAILFMHLAEITDNKKKRAFCLVGSAIILIIIAAMRSSTVGHDIRYYQTKLLLLSHSSESFSEFMSVCIRRGTEPLYCIVAYIGGKMGKTFFWTFLLNEALIIFFTYASIWNFRNIASPTLTLSCFLFFYYLRGYSQTRQFIAIAVVMFAVSLIVKGNRLVPFLLVPIAMGFHSSAIIGFALLFGYLVLNGVFSKIFLFIFTIGGISLLFFYKPIFAWALRFLPVRAEKYLKILFSNSKVEDMGYVGIVYWSLAILIMLIPVFVLHINDKTIYYFMLIMMILGLCGSFIQNVAGAVQRIFLYANVFIIIVIPQIPRFLAIKGRKSYFFHIIAYALMVTFWVVVFVRGNSGEVFPYVFASS
ncbi:EpsG family protein [Butyrivibrio sp. FCS006]|uniref:EpsG family protein n=1 Tax=Butyrivibrio sp. FCS006 TaxID=1280684 RepID=UPI0004172700|nr:EpsG family protein [Butyrivibrio sp. FCS006]